jgi:subtilisin family serine protease
MQGPRLRASLVLPISILLLLCAADASALPDLQSLPAGGWPSSVVVSKTPGTSINDAPLTTGDTLFVDLAVFNLGDAAASNVNVLVQVDGFDVFQQTVAGPVNPGFGFTFSDIPLPPLDAGVRTVLVTIDVANTIAESNENNNTGSRVITLNDAGAPEIRIDPPTVTFGAPAGLAPAILGTTDYAAEGLTGTDETPRLLEMAQEKGSIRVIARLETDFRPEGLLEEPRRSQQRTRIAGRQKEILDAVGVAVPSAKRFQTIPYIAMEVTPAQLERLRATPGVLEITEDHRADPMMVSSNTRIRSAVAWDLGYTGSGQVVAVLDTGVDKTHPWFATSSKVVSEACFSSNVPGDLATTVCPGGVTASTAVGSGVPCTANGCDHGTHVAGTVAGNDGIGPGFGVARDADIIAIQVFSQVNGSGCGSNPIPCTTAYFSDIILGLERVLALSSSMNIAAANLSLGGSSFATTCDGIFGAVKAAIDNLRAAGIATVVATGNNGFLNSIGTPACISTAVSVGAFTDFDEAASFTNLTPFTTLVAPGVAIDSAVPGGGIGSKQGTSMATPHVAGAWAVLKQAKPSATVTELVDVLRNTGRVRNDGRAGAVVTGMRRIDLGEAVTRLTAEGGFTIFNDGDGSLNVTGITPATAAPWLTMLPTTPFTLVPGAARFVSIDLNSGLAPAGSTTTRLNVASNDADENPYPDAVDVTVHNGAAGTTVTLSATDDTAVEAPASTGTFTVTRTGSTAAALTVNYTIGGTATNGTDYTTLSGSVTIGIGNASATMTVTPVNDALVEGAETVIATLAAGTGYAIGAPATGTVTITSEDLSPPSNFVATATSAAQIALTWNAVAGATSYRVYRRASTGAGFTLIASPVAASHNDSASLGVNTAYQYKVHAMAVSQSAASNFDVATTAVPAVDATIVDGSTTMKLAHWTDVRTAINSLRTLAGLGELSLTHALTAGAIARQLTVVELRTALDEARALLAVPVASYTDPALAIGNTIDGQHLRDLRAFSR